MDWQAIGAVGEVLGAAGVIITLAYLASQIKHARESMAQQAAQEVWNLNLAFLKALTTDTEACRIWRMGMTGEPGLDVDETVRFRAMLLDLAYVWQRMWEFDQGGLMAASVMDLNTTARRELMAAPGWQAWFRDRAHFLRADFRAFMEAELRELGGE